MPITTALLVVAVVLVLAVATVGAALGLHIHSSRRRASTFADQPAYQPSSVEPRGRWRISSLGDELIEPATYRLNTDPDGPGDFPPPLYPDPERRRS